VAVLVALVSGASLLALVRDVLGTNGGPALLAVVLIAATAVLAVAFGLLLRLLKTRFHWIAGIVLALVVLGVHAALAITGTQRFSIVMLRPELVIAAVSLGTGAASSIMFRGWWRALGVVGVICIFLLALTPVLVVL